MSNTNFNEIIALRRTLSPERMATYEAATRVNALDPPAAVALYTWNAAIASAFLTPLHICEVMIRNAVSEALLSLYGERWPWSPTFERSLPSPDRGYNPRRDLINARAKASSASSVIPALTFVFWQKMFTSRYDDRVWSQHLNRVFPGLGKTLPIDTSRQYIYSSLEQLRALRNRIAHHEPIFFRDQMSDYQRILALVRCRCGYTAEWLQRIQKITECISHKPPLATQPAGAGRQKQPSAQLH